MKKISVLLIVGIIVVILTGAYGGYLFWQKSASNSELKRVEKSLTDLQNQVLQFENKKVVQAINAKKTVNTLKDEMVQWSKVIKKVRATVPKEDSVPLIDILSYSVSSGKAISMNAKTFPGSENAYLDIAELIKSFDDESAFLETFVPSISAGLNDSGEEILTFIFSTMYSGEEVVVDESVEVEETEDAAEETIIR